VCGALPAAAEHEAWTGTSWRVGRTTFAHVVEIDDGWPPAYARVFQTSGPATVVTFQVADDDYHALAEIGPPFHHPPWRPNLIGLVVDAGTDWDELVELLVDSHRICAGR
jgi:hypothetical protein